MLNDCPNVKEEALLAIKWKEPVVLRQHLQEHAGDLLGTTGVSGELNLLQTALTRPGGADLSVVRTILGYVSEPGGLLMDALFDRAFNRYPVAETKGMWKGSKRKKKILA